MSKKCESGKITENKGATMLPRKKLIITIAGVLLLAGIGTGAYKIAEQQKLKKMVGQMILVGRPMTPRFKILPMI